MYKKVRFLTYKIRYFVTKVVFVYLSDLSEAVRFGISYLFEFVQFWDVCYAGQADIDEAEQLQVGELCCDSFDLSLTGATVIQNQLLDLRRGSRVELVQCGFL